MGVTPGFLPGYTEVKEAEERTRLEKAWNLPVPDQPGLGALAIFQAAEEGRVKGLYLAGENPVVTYPDSTRTKKALASLDFLVVQECFLTETASLANVVLPAVTFAEKEGTFTNADRRVQRVRQALQPIGEARSDLWIFQNLAQAMGVNLGATSARVVNEEIRSLVPLQGGISYGRLDSPGNLAGLQWPCPSPDHPGTPILYEKDFPRGKARFVPAQYDRESHDGDSSLASATGPTLFHSGSLSLMSPGLVRLQGESFVLVHPSDARTLGLADDQRVTLESEAGKISVKVSISAKAAPGVLFVPSHFGPNGGNQLCGWDLRIPRVKLEKL
jgi:predicted molibdopterin-dependent oxidoreductase YjgC